MSKSDLFDNGFFRIQREKLSGFVPQNAKTDLKDRHLINDCWKRLSIPDSNHIPPVAQGPVKPRPKTK